MQSKIKITLILIYAVIIISLIALNSNYLFKRTVSKFIESSVEETPWTAPAETYPIIILHGFNIAYSERIAELSLNELQEKIATDMNYTDKDILISETTCAELRYTQKPIIVRASYYTSPRQHSIDEYTTEVAQIIDKVQSCTGAEKVDIITHSMGGIVVRNLMRNNPTEATKIRKIIMLATPNHGGLYNVGQIADVLVNQTQQRELNITFDFLQLSENHQFMQTLNGNEGEETMGEIKYYTIAGESDGKGDGLILKESVALQGAQNSVVHCNHLAIKNPNRCPAMYEMVKEALIQE